MTVQAIDSFAPERITAVHGIIQPHIRRTPTVTLDGAEIGIPGIRVTLKLELLQHAGSFKTRGAFTHLLTRDIPAAGVAAASGGNHGAAVAYAAMTRNVPARIFVPTVSSPAKVQRIRDYGADLQIGGDRYADALAASIEWVSESHALAVHAFDEPETLLGQGTLALELEQQVPDVNTVLVAVGGGGLIGGVAAWYHGRTRVVGVEPFDAPTLTEALKHGKPVDAPAGSIAADSLAPRQVGQLMFPLAQAYVDRVVCVSDDDIRSAQRKLWQTLRVAAEPGGSAAFAALLCGRYVTSPGEHVAIVVSGGNTTAVDFGG